MKNNWFKSLFTDGEWDADISKVVGFVCIICGIVGFFMGKNEFQWVLGFGAGLLGWKAHTEGL